MHRAISRVFRGQCRKFRENDCPVAAGEEVRRNKDEDGKNGFVPRKHSLEEAITWTAGLVIGYQLTHGRRRGLIEHCPPATSVASPNCGLNSISSYESSEKTCPFSLASKVFSQPIFSQPSTALKVGQQHTVTAAAPSAPNLNRKRTSTSSTVISSIDVTPFIHDDTQDSELPDRLETPNTVVQDDDIVFAYESDPSVGVNAQEQVDCEFDKIYENPAEYGTKFGADLLSVLGAFEFLQTEAKAKSLKSASSQPTKKTANTVKKSSKKTASANFSSKNPPVHALELLKKGAELGSARAVYNIGVAYDRLNDLRLAREYYKRAADLGHPLATYNCAIFALKDGHLTEGYALMKTASDFGVPEAEEFMKPLGKSLPSQIEVGKV